MNRLLILLKMKNLYILLFILCYNCYSQNITRIYYVTVPTGGSLENNEQILKSKIAKSFVGVDEALKKLNYELLISDKKSYYHVISALDFNEKAARLARAFSSASDFYINKEKNNYIKIIEFSGEKFNVLYNINSNWELTKESKIISGYTCFKATQDRKLRLKKTDNIIKVIAWYCPSIPLSFGPKEFSGLPGLILELQDDKIVHIANKIEFKTNSKLKEFSGKVISEEEFDKIYDDTMIKTFDSMSKK